MNPWSAKAVVLAGSVAMVAIRAPHGQRSTRIKVVKSRKGMLEIVLLTLAWVGFFIPLIWVAAPLLAFADDPLRPVPFIAMAGPQQTAFWTLPAGPSRSGARLVRIASGADGIFDFNSIYNVSTYNCVNVAYSFAASDTGPLPTVLGLGSDDGAAVRLNGAPVWARGDHRCDPPPQLEVPRRPAAEPPVPRMRPGPRSGRASRLRGLVLPVSQSRSRGRGHPSPDRRRSGRRRRGNRPGQRAAASLPDRMVGRGRCAQRHP